MKESRLDQVTRELGLRMTRRYLLRAGIVASAGAVAGTAAVAGCGSAEEKKEAEWLPGIKAGDVERLDHDPECDKKIFEERLPDADELCEMALGFMWCEFTKCVHMLGSLDIEREALSLARDRLRRRIHEAVADSTLQDFTETFYPAHLEQGWTETAKKAAKGGGTIDHDRLKDAWSLEESTKKELPLPEDMGAETIGGHMWLHFVNGVLDGDGKEIDLDVYPEARRHSRYWVRKNVKDRCMAGRDIDWGKWDWAPVAHCCRSAGVRAAHYAGGSPITKDDFHKAWCETSKAFAVYVAELSSKFDQEVHTSGCGGG